MAVFVGRIRCVCSREECAGVDSEMYAWRKNGLEVRSYVRKTHIMTPCITPQSNGQIWKHNCYDWPSGLGLINGHAKETSARRVVVTIEILRGILANRITLLRNF